MAEPDSASELERLARRAVWWEPPTQALRDPRRLLCYVMARGAWDDVQVAIRHYGEDALRDAIRNPQPGILDRRSWHFWHAWLGLGHPPPLPGRVLP